MKHIEADVVLVGGGMSGLCAATQAQESLNATGGGSVVVFQRVRHHRRRSQHGHGSPCR